MGLVKGKTLFKVFHIDITGQGHTGVYINKTENFERRFSFHETHARSPRGGLTMGRTAEGRSELAELADDLASSADATIPPSPRGARPMTGR